MSVLTDDVLLAWFRDLVCRPGVIYIWAQFIFDRRDAICSVIRLFSIILKAPVSLELTEDYLQIFGDDSPELRVPRAEAVIGRSHVAALSRLERDARHYFARPSTFSVATGAVVSTRCLRDKMLTARAPRKRMVRRICAHLLVWGDQKGVYFPVVFVIAAAAARLSARKSMVRHQRFLAQIIDDLFRDDTLHRKTRDCANHLSAQQREARTDLASGASSDIVAIRRYDDGLYF